ncbi:MAG: hypothetical protein LHV68_05290 [Elusimicrobia bacterium]|nr:hypothetical protein [Candidatus Liberimonas magnetica]
MKKTKIALCIFIVIGLSLVFLKLKRNSLTLKGQYDGQWYTDMYKSFRIKINNLGDVNTLKEDIKENNFSTISFNDNEGVMYKFVFGKINDNVSEDNYIDHLYQQGIQQGRKCKLCETPFTKKCIMEISILLDKETNDKPGIRYSAIFARNRSLYIVEIEKNFKDMREAANYKEIGKYVDKLWVNTIFI